MAPISTEHHKDTEITAAVVTNADKCSNWLQRIRETGEFSDVIVEVEGQGFSLHMLPLLSSSLFFRTLPPSTHVGGGYVNLTRDAHGRHRVILPDDLVGGAEAFSIAADFCYLIKPKFTVKNAAPVLAAAEYLGMPELLESTKNFLNANVFTHWRVCISFLMQYKKVGASALHDYVQSRCLRVIIATCVEAFRGAKKLSAPIFLGRVHKKACHRSPSLVLADILVRTCSLQDEYLLHIVDELINAQVNLNLKCRQGRNVKSWIDSTIGVEWLSTRGRCWIVVCLARMLEKSVTMDRPWLELSSQYWCSLLYHAGCCMQQATDELAAAINSKSHKENNVTPWTQMLDRLISVNGFLEQRIGGSLNELDEYLQNYKFRPRVLFSLVGHFHNAVHASALVNSDNHQEDLLQICTLDNESEVSGAVTEQVHIISEEAMGEVAMEVDACLWNLIQDGASLISPHDVIYLVQSFPPSSHESYDPLYTSIEKFLQQYTNVNRDNSLNSTPIKAPINDDYIVRKYLHYHCQIRLQHQHSAESFNIEEMEEESSSAGA